MPGLCKYRTVPKLSRLLCSVTHPPPPPTPFPSGSVVHSARIKTVSDTCHMSGSVPVASNDPVPLYPVTLQRHSVCPRQSLPLSPSCPPPFSASVLTSSRTLLLLLLPTPSFTIHILEDIYEHESERVCVHQHHFQCAGNLHFSPGAFPSPPPLPYPANIDSGFGFMMLIFF